MKGSIIEIKSNCGKKKIIIDGVEQKNILKVVNEVITHDINTVTVTYWVDKYIVEEEMR